MKTKYTLLTLVGVSCSASGAVISIDVNNTTAGGWVLSGPAEIAGPLSTGNWNNTSSASGGPQALVDDGGAGTGASLTWSSSNTWTNGDGNASLDRQILHAYLDDGGSGVSLNITNIPYAQYKVYILVSSGQNGDNSTYTTLDYQVNGDWVLGSIINGDETIAATATAYGDWDGAGSAWVELTGDGVGNQTQTGNYITHVTSGNTLTINGQNRAGNSRGSLAGILIEEVPEPSSSALLGLGGLALILRRRKE